MAARKKNVVIPEEKKIQIMYWMIENKEDLIHENDINHPSYKTKKCHARLLEYINQLIGFSAYSDYATFRYVCHIYNICAYKVQANSVLFAGVEVTTLHVTRYSSSLRYIFVTFLVKTSAKTFKMPLLIHQFCAKHEREKL